MGSAEVLRILGNKYNAEILGAASEAKSANELSDELGIPIATSYRRIEELTEVELLVHTGQEFSKDGRRTKMYRRNVDEISIEFEDREVIISFEERGDVRNSLVKVWTHLGDD